MKALEAWAVGTLWRMIVFVTGWIVFAQYPVPA